MSIQIPHWEIVIATYNRSQSLNKLLFSIERMSLKPNAICVVSAGENIEKIISVHKSLKIRHFVSRTANQSFQKKKAISMVSDYCKWIAFLDDDVLVRSDAFESIFKFIDKNEIYENIKIGGVGFKISNQNQKLSNTVNKKIANIFCLNNSRLGLILKSGHAVSYQESIEPIETEWLNGISMWKTELARDYGKKMILSRYCAYEDVIFSYPQRKSCQLWYLPTAVVDLQENLKTNYFDPNIIYLGLLWRYYFIKQNKELSEIAFYWSVLGRYLFDLFNSGASIRRQLKLSKLYIRFLVATLTKKNLHNLILSTYIK